MTKKCLYKSTLITIVSMVFILNGCGTNPVTGKREFQLVSESEEVNIGKENYLPSQQSQGGQYNVDPELTQYVNSVGQKLAKVSDRPSLPYEFVVLNNSVPNAWALPGGKIAVNRGLLLELKNEAELAAVLGHEIVHAAARHGAKSMERGMLLNAGVVGLGIAAGDQENAEMIVGAAALGSKLVNQKYGRDAELESDKFGIQYMARAGYDPFAAVELQKTFVRLSGEKGKSGGWLDGLFASHPPSQDRVENNIKIAQKLNATGELHEKQYQQKTAHIRKTQPAYEIYGKAQTAVKNNNLQQAKQLIDDALKIEPREGLFHALKGDIYYEQKDYKTAEQHYSNAINENPNLFLFYLERGLTREKLNKLSDARLDLEKSVKLLPTAPAYNVLGNIALKNNDNEKAKDYFRIASGSDSSAGKQAAASYAKLDLPANPSKYLTVKTLRMPDGKLGVSITNQSPITVGNVDGTVALHANNGNLISDHSINYGKPIGAGKSVSLSTDIPFSSIDQATKVSAKITRATAASDSNN